MGGFFLFLLQQSCSVDCVNPTCFRIELLSSFVLFPESTLSLPSSYNFLLVEHVLLRKQIFFFSNFRVIARDPGQACECIFLASLSDFGGHM